MLKKDLKKHASVSCSNDINLICRPLISKTPVSVVDYSKVFKDGSRLELSNHVARLEAAIISCSTVMRHIYTPSLIPDNQRYLFITPWLDTLNSSAGKILKARTQAQKDFFNLSHELRIITRTEDYTEMFHFYAATETIGIENFYLNNICLLEQFVLYFRDAAHNFIKTAEKQPIIKPWRAANSNIIIFDEHNNLIELSERNEGLNNANLTKNIYPKKFYFKIESREDYLTKREIDCALYLTQGKTNKEIAESLFISIRTVEKHIEAIFNKTCCTSRRELTAFLKNKGIPLAFCFG